VLDHGDNHVDFDEVGPATEKASIVSYFLDDRSMFGVLSASLKLKTFRWLLNVNWVPFPNNRLCQPQHNSAAFVIDVLYSRQYYDQLVCVLSELTTPMSTLSDRAAFRNINCWNWFMSW